MASRTESIPPLSLTLAFGPALLLLMLAAGGWLLPPRLQPLAVSLGWLWGTAILLFLAGVTRGLSFFTPGGPRPVQLATMLWLFLLGFGAMLTPLRIALILLAIGHGSIALLDPPAARGARAPAYFARLRPPQMAIMVAALLILFARVTLRG